MSHRRIAAALACLAVAAPAVADPVAFPFSPEAGTVWTVTETRTRTTTQAGRPPRIEATTTGRLTIIEKTRRGYTMEWTVETLTADGVTVSEEDKLTDLFIGVPVRFTADPTGAPIKVEDSQALVESALASLSRLGVETEDKNVRAMLMQTMTQPAMIISTMLPQAQLIANCQGFQLEPGKMLSQDTDSVNVLGGPPIPAITTVLLEDAGSATTPARIRIVESYKPEAAAAAVFESTKAIMKQRGLPPPKPGEIPSLARVADMACQIDATSGETQKVVLDMKADAGVMMQKRDIRDITVTRRN